MLYRASARPSTESGSVFLQVTIGCIVTFAISFPGARNSLQRLVGDFVGEDLFFSLVRSGASSVIQLGTLLMADIECRARSFATCSGRRLLSGAFVE